MRSHIHRVTTVPSKPDALALTPRRGVVLDAAAAGRSAALDEDDNVEIESRRFANNSMKMVEAAGVEPASENGSE